MREKSNPVVIPGLIMKHPIWNNNERNVVIGWLLFPSVWPSLSRNVAALSYLDLASLSMQSLFVFRLNIKTVIHVVCMIGRNERWWSIIQIHPIPRDHHSVFPISAVQNDSIIRRYILNIDSNYWQLICLKFWNFFGWVSKWISFKF